MLTPAELAWLKQQRRLVLAAHRRRHGMLPEVPPELRGELRQEQLDHLIHHIVKANVEMLRRFYDIPDHQVIDALNHSAAELALQRKDPT